MHAPPEEKNHRHVLLWVDEDNEDVLHRLWWGIAAQVSYPGSATAPGSTLTHVVKNLITKDIECCLGVMPILVTGHP